MDGGALSKRAVVCGSFVGAVLEDVTLPIPQHDTVALVKITVFLSQIREYDTRILIDVISADLNLKVSMRYLRAHMRLLLNEALSLYRNTSSPTSSHHSPHRCTSPSIRPYRKAVSGVCPTRSSHLSSKADRTPRGGVILGDA